MSRGILATLIGIAAAVTQTVNIVNTINTLVNAIHNLLFPPGPPIDFQTQATEIASIQAHVLDPTYGLQALQALMVANQTALLAAIGTPQQAGSAVTLPTTPPSGYGSTDAAAVAAAVWATVGPTSSHGAMSMLEDSASFPNQWALWNDQVNSSQLAGWRTVWTDLWSEPVSFGFPIPSLDFSTVLATDDTAVDWINRVAGSVIVFDFGGGVPGATDDFGNAIYAEALNTPFFQLLRNQQLGLGKTRVPPVWPGLANVTIGSPSTLTDGLTITGPMDGVIVAVTSAPPGKAKYVYGTVTAYQHIGALSFEDDNGEQEAFQPVQFESQVYCPQFMVTSAGVRFKVAPGVTGTATPFVNNL